MPNMPICHVRKLNVVICRRSINLSHSKHVNMSRMVIERGNILKILTNDTVVNLRIWQIR